MQQIKFVLSCDDLETGRTRAAESRATAASDAAASALPRDHSQGGEKTASSRTSAAHEIGEGA